MIKVYCYDRCSTCKKAVDWLNAHKIEFEKIDIKAKSGLELKRFFNTSGILYREMELSKKLPSMSDDEKFHLLSSDGMLVKRPLLVTDDTVCTGFREEEWKKALLK